MRSIDFNDYSVFVKIVIFIQKNKQDACSCLFFYYGRMAPNVQSGGKIARKEFLIKTRKRY